MIFIKAGLNAYSKINLLEKEHPLRINTGIQFSTELSSISFSISGQGLLQADSPEHSPQNLQKEALSFQIKNSWYLKTFTPALSLSAEKKLIEEADEKDRVKYKIQLNLTNNATHKIYGSCAYFFTTADGEIEDKKLTASLTCRLNYKRLTIIGKLSTSLE